MAITGVLSVVETDLSLALDGGIVSSCSPNVLKMNAVLSGGTDADAYCLIKTWSQDGSFYTFKMINLNFDGVSGDFFFDFSEILSSFFTDVSDDVLKTGVQTVNDTFWKIPRPDVNMFEIKLYKSNGDLLDSYSFQDASLLFSSKKIGESTNEIFWDIINKVPNFIGQKNKVSYIYFNNSTLSDFNLIITKVNYVPNEIALIDNLENSLIDNSNKILTFTL